ncbi:hypothetical protein BD413DRAFT_40773 [Trametes elegans]|nr:hypothetical protein BD413DRAFT_40773 [Trametes elegans]
MPMTRMCVYVRGQKSYDRSQCSAAYTRLNRLRKCKPRGGHIVASAFLGRGVFIAVALQPVCNAMLRVGFLRSFHLPTSPPLNIGWFALDVSSRSTSVPPSHYSLLPGLYSEAASYTACGERQYWNTLIVSTSALVRGSCGIWHRGHHALLLRDLGASLQSSTAQIDVAVLGTRKYLP